MDVSNALQAEVWTPVGINRIVARGNGNFIGTLDNTTVLKYCQIPYVPLPQLTADGQLGQEIRKKILQKHRIEERMHQTLGHHQRIVRYKGRWHDGILLEYMFHGSLWNFMHGVTDPPPMGFRLKWALQAAEAVSFIHMRGVLHCNLNPTAFLLDSQLNLKLSNFQGKMFSGSGQLILDGGATEDVKCALPQPPGPRESSMVTDIFALGTVIYYIITGHMPFPDLSMNAYREIISRYSHGQFPHLPGDIGGMVTSKCWNCQYRSACEVVGDLRLVQPPRGAADPAYDTPFHGGVAYSSQDEDDFLDENPARPIAGHIGPMYASLVHH